MSIDRSDDLSAFKGIIDEKLANGGAELGLDEALARWEDEIRTTRNAPNRFEPYGKVWLTLKRAGYKLLKISTLNSAGSTGFRPEYNLPS